jgi:hypothetical protein
MVNFDVCVLVIMSRYDLPVFVSRIIRAFIISLNYLFPLRLWYISIKILFLLTYICCYY